jgi:hypothetical protein
MKKRNAPISSVVFSKKVYIPQISLIGTILEKSETVSLNQTVLPLILGTFSIAQDS